MNANTMTSFSSYESWLRHHGCYELATRYSQGDRLGHGSLGELLHECSRLPAHAGIVEQAFKGARLLEVWSMPDKESSGGYVAIAVIAGTFFGFFIGLWASEQTYVADCKSALLKSCERDGGNQ